MRPDNTPRPAGAPDRSPPPVGLRCPDCGGTGFRVIREGGSGRSYAGPCPCTREERVRALLRRARIPSRYFERPALERELRTPDKANAVLRAGLNLPMRDDHADFPALILGSYLLGGSSTGRLPARIREKEGLSYSTHAGFSASPLDALAGFGASAIFAPQNKARVEQALREEIVRAREEGFAAAELAAAKKGLLEARRLARTQDGALASRLGNYLLAGRSFAWDDEFERRIAALKAEEVRDALRRHLDPLRLSVSKAGDFK